MLVKKSVDEFVEVLASNAPVPGGGGAAALVGAIGMALGSMVGNLTVGKEKYKDVEAEVIEILNEAKKTASSTAGSCRRRRKGLWQSCRSL